MLAPSRPGPADFVAVAAAYFVSAKLSLFTVLPGGLAIVWLPTAVLLAALILFDRRASAFLAVIAIVVQVIAGVGHGSVTDAFILGIIGTGEALLAASILRRRRFEPTEMTIRDAASFALAGPIVASVAGAVVYSFLRGADGGGLEIFRIRWAADALGMTLVTPALLALALRRSVPLGAPGSWTLWD